MIEHYLKPLQLKNSLFGSVIIELHYESVGLDFNSDLGSQPAAHPSVHPSVWDSQEMSIWGNLGEALW